MTKPIEDIIAHIQAIAPDEQHFVIITVNDHESMRLLSAALNQHMQDHKINFRGVVMPVEVNVQMLDDQMMNRLGWARISGPVSNTIQ